MKKNLLVLLLFPMVLFGQTQIGENIEGATEFDIFGYSVSSSDDGSIMAIAAPSSSGLDNYVSVYENISGVWTQVGEDIEGSGTRVSISSDGTTVAIGSNGSSNLRGRVRVYENISGVWTQIGADIDGEGAEDFSGTSVGISGDGNIVAIGAPENSDNGFRAGHVRVYENISGVWTQVGEDIDGEAEGDYSGNSLSISGDGSIVAIGARFNEGDNGFTGHVRVYENISGVWTQIGADINGEAGGDQFGKSVSITSDGSIVAIGSDVNNGFTGHVRVYENISGVWTQIGADIDGEAGGDQSGFSVSISDNGEIVAIGAIGNDDNGEDSGEARIYQNVSGVWTQIGTDIDGEVAGDRFGRSVSLSSNGETLIVGAPFNDNPGNASGQVKIYDLSDILVLSTNDVLLENTVVVYPNPASKTIIVQLDSNTLLEEITVYNNLGQLVQTENDVTIDISKLVSGTYYLQVTTNKGVATKQLIVK